MPNRAECKKHAYLVIAHDNFYILEKQIKMLDHINNDIYIHIDKRVKNFDFKYFLSVPKKSKIFFTERIKVYWGHYSQIQCELILLKKASKQEYAYYHLLSGVDLPLKSQDDIHHFFEKNEGKEFVHFLTNNWDIENDIYRRRIGQFHFISKHYRHKSPLISITYKILDHFLVRLQRIFKVNRIKGNESKFKFGSNWFSITHIAAKYIISQEEWIKKTFNYSLCPDELFLQTILLNSQFKNSIINDNVRLIDFDRGKNSSPYTFKKDDYDELMNSDLLFARKFDENADRKVVDLIYNYVMDGSDSMASKQRDGSIASIKNRC
jgi:hypothetical protein